VTTQRVFLFKHGVVQKAVAIADIVEIEKGADSSGHFSVFLITSTALPYAGFRNMNVSNKSSMLFWKNCLLLHLSTPQMVEDFSSTVEAVSH
jgi:hypothetical protein